MVSREIVFLLFAVKLFVSSSIGFGASSIKVGDSPEIITLDGDDGGRVDGKPWSSSEINSKVFVLMYIDPDQKNDNEHLQEALRDQAYGPERLGSVAIINMAATWIPNVAINATLEGKQKDFPHTTYVKDLKKNLVRKWGLSDDSYCVLLFDKMGKVLFRKDGRLSDDEVKTLIKLAWQQIDPSKAL